MSFIRYTSCLAPLMTRRSQPLCSAFTRPTHHQASRLVLILACLLAIVFSARLIGSEYRLAILNAGSTNDVIDSLTVPGATLPMPATARSMRETTSRCARTIRSAPRLKADPEADRLVRARCLELAEAILRSAPSNARARALALVASPAPLTSDLALAQSAAPQEPWPLLQRLAVLERVGPQDALWQSVAEADLDAALATSWGRAELAQLYVDTPALRPLVEAVAEGASEAAQAYFIAQVRAASRGAF